MGENARKKARKKVHSLSKQKGIGKTCSSQVKRKEIEVCMRKHKEGFPKKQEKRTSRLLGHVSDGKVRDVCRHRAALHDKEDQTVVSARR